ncbi:MAG: hypothetical protein AABW67_00860 [Nanoarchaeota archaeon]
MENKNLLLFVGVIFFVSLVGLMLTPPNITGNAINTNSDENEDIKITYNNLADVLSKNKIVLDLPKDSKVLLGEYGGDSNHMYLIEKEKITEITEKPEVDFEISINSKYLEELTNNNYCDVLSKAIDKNDFKLKLYKSKLSLFWKYKFMMKYGGCFGI